MEAFSTAIRINASSGFFCRYGSNIRHRVVEDKLIRQKAQLLLDEAASWSLLWYLYGKGNLSLTLKFYSNANLFKKTISRKKLHKFLGVL